MSKMYLCILTSLTEIETSSKIAQRWKAKYNLILKLKRQHTVHEIIHEIIVTLTLSPVETIKWNAPKKHDWRHTYYLVYHAAIKKKK